jgi:CubicO group peptidase (beta-lactamase class C family)
MRAVTLLLATMILGPLTAFSQARFVTRLDGTRISAAQIDLQATSAMREAGVPGLGIAIFDNGKIAYLKTYGKRDTSTGAPLTPDSVMTAASLTKPAFAVLVLRLMQQGVLDLDRPVYQYLPKPLPEYPSYRDLAADPRYRQLTLRMLLDHTSGFPNWRRFTDDRKLRIYFRPGARFAYSGEGISLAQLVVETVTKMPLDTLMQAQIFGPLGMTRTAMTWQRQFESDFANGYDEHGGSLGPERRKRGDAAGSMQTTLHDYARFIEAFLDGQLLGDPARAQMLTPQVQIRSLHEFPTMEPATTNANAGIRLSYGLGWGLYWTALGETFFKEGHDEGWRHYTACFDGPKTGILIMTNSSNGEDLYGPLLETLLRDVYTPYLWEGFKPPRHPAEVPVTR